MDKNIILKSYLGEIETEEQDLVLYNDFFTEEEMEHDHPEILIHGDTGNYSDECAPIKIDEMIETLQSFKSDGANYVEIGYHTDHFSYLLNAIKIRKATEEEIKEEEARKGVEEFFEKQQRIQELKKELEELEEE